MINLRLAISVPLPWLTILTGRFYPGGKVRGKPRQRLPWLPRSLKITREGRWFIGVLLIVGLAAINTGNNLLYLVVATLLSLIVISGIISESTLRGVNVKRVLPNHFFKGIPAPIKLHVANRKKHFPSFSLCFNELALVGLTAKDPYILKLDPRASVEVPTTYTFTRRGVFTLTGLKVSTRFPFGIFLKGREETTNDEVIVYPSIKPVKAVALADIYRGAGAQEKSRRGAGTELYNLRGYTLADNSRFIYWRAAAKTGELFIKEFVLETEKKVILVFKNHCTEGGEELFEETVDEAAGVIKHFIDRGYSVGLETLDTEIAPGQGHYQLLKLLRTLALISPSSTPATPVLKVVFP
jgi:uncharacterized protein (DUF58 family)